MSKIKKIEQNSSNLLCQGHSSEDIRVLRERESPFSKRRPRARVLPSSAGAAARRVLEKELESTLYLAPSRTFNQIINPAERAFTKDLRASIPHSLFGNLYFFLNETSLKEI